MLRQTSKIFYMIAHFEWEEKWKEEFILSVKLLLCVLIYVSYVVSVYLCTFEIKIIFYYEITSINDFWRARDGYIGVQEVVLISMKSVRLSSLKGCIVKFKEDFAENFRNESNCLWLKEDIEKTYTWNNLEIFPKKN